MGWNIFLKIIIFNFVNMRKLDNIAKNSGGSIYNIKNTAFTLIELIVVIVIIWLLVTIWFLNFSSQRQLAKDTVRAQDLKTISNLLDLSFWKWHDFPKPNVTTMSWWVLYQETIDWKQFETWTFGWDAIIAQFWEEASKISLDPNDKTEYYYSLSKDKRFYILRAKLDSGWYYAIANYMTSLPSDILAKNTTTWT